MNKNLCRRIIRTMNSSEPIDVDVNKSNENEQNPDDDEDDDDPFSMAFRELSETNRIADELARVSIVY